MSCTSADGLSVASTLRLGSGIIVVSMSLSSSDLSSFWSIYLLYVCAEVCTSRVPAVDVRLRNTFEIGGHCVDVSKSGTWRAFVPMRPASNTANTHYFHYSFLVLKIFFEMQRHNKNGACPSLDFPSLDFGEARERPYQIYTREST